MLRLIKIIIWLFLLNCFNSNITFANNFTLKECTQISDVVNKDVPKIIDKVTTLIGTVCTLGPVFIYNYQVDNSIDYIPNSFDAKVRKQWCSNPRFKVLINRLEAINFEYYKNNGDFVKTIVISKKYC